MKKRIKIVLVVATIVALPLDPNKDYTQATLHELKNAARFYEEQENFADCTDYQQQAKIDEIIGRTYAARMVNNNK